MWIVVSVFPEKRGGRRELGWMLLSSLMNREIEGDGSAFEDGEKNDRMIVGNR